MDMGDAIHGQADLAAPAKLDIRLSDLGINFPDAVDDGCIGPVSISVVWATGTAHDQPVGVILAEIGQQPAGVGYYLVLGDYGSGDIFRQRPGCDLVAVERNDGFAECADQRVTVNQISIAIGADQDRIRGDTAPGGLDNIFT